MKPSVRSIIAVAAALFPSLAWSAGPCDLWSYFTDPSTARIRPPVSGSVPLLKPTDLPRWLADDYYVITLRDPKNPNAAEPVLLESVTYVDDQVVIEFARGESGYFPRSARDFEGVLPTLDPDQLELGKAPDYELVKAGDYVARGGDPRMIARIRAEANYYEGYYPQLETDFTYRIDRGVRRMSNDPVRAQALRDFRSSANFERHRKVAESINKDLSDPRHGTTEGPLSLIEIKEIKQRLKKARVDEATANLLIDSGVIGRQGSYETPDVAAARLYGVPGADVVNGEKPVIVIPRVGTSLDPKITVADKVTKQVDTVTGKESYKIETSRGSRTIVATRSADDVVLVDAETHFSEKRTRLPKDEDLEAEYKRVREAVAARKKSRANENPGHNVAPETYVEEHLEPVVVRLANGDVFVARGGKKGSDGRWTLEHEPTPVDLDPATGYGRRVHTYKADEVSDVIPAKKFFTKNVWEDTKNAQLVKDFKRSDRLSVRLKNARENWKQTLKKKLAEARTKAKREKRKLTAKEIKKIEEQMAEDLKILTSIEKKIARDIDGKLTRAIDDAHEVGRFSGDGGKYTDAELKKKTKILADAGLDQKERGALMRLGIAGDFHRTPSPSEVAAIYEVPEQVSQGIVVRSLPNGGKDVFSVEQGFIDPPLGVYQFQLKNASGGFAIRSVELGEFEWISLGHQDYARWKILADERGTVFSWARRATTEVAPLDYLNSEMVGFFSRKGDGVTRSGYGYFIKNGELKAYTGPDQRTSVSLGKAEDWSIVPLSVMKAKKAKDPGMYESLDQWVDVLLDHDHKLKAMRHRDGQRGTIVSNDRAVQVAEAQGVAIGSRANGNVPNFPGARYLETKDGEKIIPLLILDRTDASRTIGVDDEVTLNFGGDDGGATEAKIVKIEKAADGAVSVRAFIKDPSKGRWETRGLLDGEVRTLKLKDTPTVKAAKAPKPAKQEAETPVEKKKAALYIHTRGPGRHVRVKAGMLGRRKNAMIKKIERKPDGTTSVTVAFEDNPHKKVELTQEQLVSIEIRDEYVLASAGPNPEIKVEPLRNPVPRETVASRKHPPMGGNEELGPAAQLRKEMNFLKDDEIVKIHEPVVLRKLSSVDDKKQRASVEAGFNERGKLVIQQQTGRGCTAATSAMLIHDAGGTPNLLDVARRDLGSTFNQVNDIQNAGYEAAVSTVNTPLALAQEIQKNGAAILSVSGDLGPHSIVVDSIDLKAGIARIRDPWHGWDITVRISALERVGAFKGTDNVIQIKRFASP